MSVSVCVIDELEQFSQSMEDLLMCFHSDSSKGIVYVRPFLSFSVCLMLFAG